MAKVAYKRILLKLSGEALSGEGSHLDQKACHAIASGIQELHRLKMQN